MRHLLLCVIKLQSLLGNVDQSVISGLVLLLGAAKVRDALIKLSHWNIPPFLYKFSGLW